MEKKKIKSVGIIVNPTKTGSFPLIEQVVDWLRRRGLEVLMDASVSGMLDLPLEYKQSRELPRLVDFIIAFGGDGTMLSVAKQMNGCSTPLIGVKVGGLGFLTGVTETEVFTTLEEVLQGLHRIEERMMLDCTVIHSDGSIHREQVALNDVVIQRDALERMLMLETYVDEEFLATYACDGLIISTPTGSTAHSLSAGGPIIYPEAEAIVITPICPHMLTNRPLVLSSNQVTRVVIASEHASPGLMIDGQIAVELHQWDQVIIKKSPHTIRLAASANKSYFEVLRNKLNWGRR
ncbi:MAG: NAD(+)/NADH kinase [Candidatus Abyssobacteria bacterium SURF_5]|uniref:NAD kinase n=1 Tax=Abyssobacteria bacterium (strain SURF_5) TaxID=2093360 RepID=A0A3A4N8A0_ABYX5|nr:MAG: NAD(+)/NADH kinase [Candidatus Abyssubacteria bacterium SURF_5]